MSKIDDRLAERRRQATEAAQAASQPTPPVPADNGQARDERATEKPAAKPPTVRPARPARTAKAAEEPAEMSKDELGDWRWRLGASARKAVAAQQRAHEAAQAWERVVTQARIEGVPERLLMAAALEADMELPEAE